MARRRVISTLTSPGSALLNHMDTLKCGWKVDGGWNWGATIDSATYDITHGRASQYAMSITDGYGNTLTKSDFTAGPRDQGPAGNISEPGTTNLGGTDATTLKMAKAQQNFPSFKAVTSTSLLSTLATRAGITVSGLEEWHITEEEVKGETVEAALSRLLEVSAYDSVIGVGGGITCTPWEDVGASLTFAYESVRRFYDPFRIYTGKRLGKRSSIPISAEQTYEFDHADSYVQALTTPVLGPGAYESDLLGAIAAVAFFDADPGTGGGLLAFYSFDPAYVVPGPATGSGPATHMTVVCKNIGMPYPINAILKVTGTPYGVSGLPTGVDLSFLYPSVVPTVDTSLGDWPSTGELIDPLFPGLTWATARYPYILAKENWGGDYLSMSGILDVSVVPLSRFTYASHAYKVMEIAHDVGSITTSLTLGRV